MRDHLAIILVMVGEICIGVVLLVNLLAQYRVIDQMLGDRHGLHFLRRISMLRLHPVLFAGCFTLGLVSEIVGYVISVVRQVISGGIVLQLRRNRLLVMHQHRQL